MVDWGRPWGRLGKQYPNLFAVPMNLARSQKNPHSYTHRMYRNISPMGGRTRCVSILGMGWYVPDGHVSTYQYDDVSIRVRAYQYHSRQQMRSCTSVFFAAVRDSDESFNHEEKFLDISPNVSVLDSHVFFEYVRGGLSTLHFCDTCTFCKYKLWGAAPKRCVHVYTMCVQFVSIYWRFLMAIICKTRNLSCPPNCLTSSACSPRTLWTRLRCLASETKWVDSERKKTVTSPSNGCPPPSPFLQIFEGRYSEYVPEYIPKSGFLLGIWERKLHISTYHVSQRMRPDISTYWYNRYQWYVSICIAYPHQLPGGSAELIHDTPPSSVHCQKKNG